ncbi:hypothetical protein [Streptomyces sp. SID3343]|uniref:hypothetical protein n=1 Tax=Streptomyces sp. SID3343 TaxID=2690260 RepID=UPI00136B144F|nr:hypothetical protein [Streptomyces sp. SID3343]MYW00231.1 hypothetical protein [Streptomyces sp. SID3343]
MTTAVRRRSRVHGQLDLFTTPAPRRREPQRAVRRPVRADTTPRCACGEPAIARVVIARDLLSTPYAAPRARVAYRAEHGVWYPLTGARLACEQHRDYYLAMYRHEGHVHAVRL